METRDEMDLDIPDGPTTNTTRIQFKIEIYGDVVCPWCYLGKKSLDAAVEAYITKYPDDCDVFDIVWKPFILWPTAEVSAYGKRAPILGMVGPVRAPAVFDRLAITGAQYGIHFNWDGLVGNSADANKLVVLAYEIDQQRRLRAQQEEQQQQGGQATTTPRNFSSSTPPPEPTNPAAAAKVISSNNNSYPSPGPGGKTSPPSPALSVVSSSSSSSSSVPRNPILNPTQHTFLEALFYETLTQGFDPSSRGFLISLALNMEPPLGASPSALAAYLDSEDANEKVGLSPPRRPPPLRATNSTRPSSSSSSSSSSSPQQKEQGENAKEHEKEKEAEAEKQNPYNEKKDIKAIINGVPSVVVQGRYRVGGFQKPEVYLAVFEKVREMGMGVSPSSRAELGTAKSMNGAI